MRTMKEECIWLRDWRSAAELRTALDAWMRHYNANRPHSSLDSLTPVEFADKVNAGLTLSVA